MRTYTCRLVLATIMFIALLPQLSTGQVTHPEDYLGFRPGDDFKLATFEQIIGYLELIAEESDRIQIHNMGQTTEGRLMQYAIISSVENMENLERYKEISRKLSLVRGVSLEEAENLAEEGKAVVWIDGGLHSTEVAPSLVNIQLAYDIVTGKDRQTQFIRDNVIFLLVFPNPDGVTKVAEWYLKNIGTQYEISPMPELYHKYIGHDNNRDSFIANAVETWNMNRFTGHEWFLQVHYNQHQTAPFPARIWVPPFGEPTNPNTHPVITRWVNLIGTEMARALDLNDQPGAISRTIFNPWYPGFLKTLIEGQNTPAVMSETGLYRYATPHYYPASEFPEEYKTFQVGQFYPSPWKGGWWRIGDAVSYNLTTTKSVLEVAAKFRHELLFSKWKLGSDNIERFRSEPPYGWIIPVYQRDVSTTVQVLNNFINSGIEVYRADDDFTQDGIPYSSGSYIVPTSQPFGLYVKSLMEVQDFPDLREYPSLWKGARPTKDDIDPIGTYDGAGWTIPFQFGIESSTIHTPISVAMSRIENATIAQGNVQGNGSHFVFSSTDNNSYKAVNLIIEEGGTIHKAQEPFTINSIEFSRGAFVIDAGSINKGSLEEISDATGIAMLGSTVLAPLKPLKQPLVGLYKSWVANMDAGWISLLFERYSIPYSMLVDAEIKAGKLRDRFDVIVLSDQRVSSIINGHMKGTISPEFAGGITQNGVDNLVRFVKEGGTLICNNASTGLAIDAFDIPVINTVDELTDADFVAPGSLFNIKLDTSHELTFGMKDKGIGYFSNGNAFEIVSDEENGESIDNDLSVTIVAHYPDQSVLASGWLIGEEYVAGHAAILDVAIEEGKVILFGFNVQNRAQSNRNFKLLFNALYY